MLSIAALMVFGFGCYHFNAPLMLASLLVIVLQAMKEEDE